MHFCIHYCTKIKIFIWKIVLKFQQKCAHDSRKIHFLKLKMQQLLGPPNGPLTLGLQTNVSVNKINFKEQILSKWPESYVLK